MSELSNVRYPDWEPHYKAAMLELDHSKLKERVQAAHIAISERLRILSQDPSESHIAYAQRRNGYSEQSFKHNAELSTFRDESKALHLH
jgi:hypothetical protein